MLLHAICFALLSFYVQANTEGIYHERSGDIVLSQPVHATVQTSWSMNDIEVKDVQVYNLLARVLGAPRVRQAESNDAPVSDVFAPQKRALIFSIEGLESSGLPADLKTLGKTKASLITPSAAPATPFSIIASALSGSPTSAHGVVHKGWPSYEPSRDEFYATANLYDRLLQVQHRNANPSQGGLISGSFSALGSRLVSPHAASLNELSAQRGRSFYWDKKAGRFTSLFGDESTGSGLEIGKTSFCKLISGIKGASVEKITCNPETATIIVKIVGHNSVVFDLSHEADVALFAELLFVVNTANFVQSETPKVFSFHFESMLMLLEKYGQASPQYTVALYLLDTVITSIRNTEKSPSQKVFDEFVIFFVPSAHHSSVLNLIKKVQKKIDTVSSFLVSKLPHIYFNLSSTHYDHKKASTLCEHIKSTLESQGHKNSVVCNTALPPQKRSVETVSSAQQTPIIKDDKPVRQLHMILWTVVGLFCTLGATMYCLFSVSGQAQADNTLYGQTRTIFELSKQNRKKHK